MEPAELLVRCNRLGPMSISRPSIPVINEIRQTTTVYSTYRKTTFYQNHYCIKTIAKVSIEYDDVVLLFK